MEIRKAIEIDGQPLNCHQIETFQVDLTRAVVSVRVLSWYSEAAKAAQTPPHRAHDLVSIGMPEELAAVLMRALAAGPLDGGQIVIPPSTAEPPEAAPTV